MVAALLPFVVINLVRTPYLGVRSNRNIRRCPLVFGRTRCRDSDSSQNTFGSRQRRQNSSQTSYYFAEIRTGGVHIHRTPSPFNRCPLIVREVAREVLQVVLRGALLVCLPVRVHDIHPALYDFKGCASRKRDKMEREHVTARTRRNKKRRDKVYCFQLTHAHRLWGLSSSLLLMLPIVSFLTKLLWSESKSMMLCAIEIVAAASMGFVLYAGPGGRLGELSNLLVAGCGLESP